jgi:general secretion pathway protein M
MDWLRSHRQSAWIVGITLIVPAVLFLYAFGSLLTARADIQAQIDRLEPRVARVQGLALAQAELEAALQSGGDNAGMVYASSQDQASVSAALQSEVRRLLTDAGLSITNSQVLPAEQLESFDRIAISVMATGDVGALDAALSNLALYRPLLLIEALDVYPNRVRRRAATQDAPQTLTARIQIMSLRSTG